jgi:hypothetical protein
MSCNRGKCFAGVLILTFAFLLGGLGSGFCQTADEYFALGKADLANESLAAAHSNFQQALSLDANHQGANFFYALTSVLMVSNSSEFSTLLDRAGVSATGRNVFRWEADFAHDAYGNILLPANAPTGEDLQSFAKNSLLPAVSVAINSLGKVNSSFLTYFNWAFAKGEGGRSGLNKFATYSDYWEVNEWVGYKLVVGGSEYSIVSNTNTVLTVSPNLSVPAGTYEYKIVTPIEIDYGDALAIRGGMNLAKAAILIFTAYNFNVDIDALFSLINTAGFNVQTQVIQAYPQLLTLSPTQQMADAKASIGDSITQLTAAIDFILNESDPQGNDLFILNPDEGAQFSAALGQWKNALDGPVFIDSMNTQVDLSQFFDHPKILRNYLPVFHGMLIKRGSFPDPAFGGIFPAMTATEINRILEEANLLAPNDETDWDGDGKSDLTIYRPSSGVWYELRSSYPGGYASTQWGLPGDKAVPCDYDGDGTNDRAVYRPSTGVWYVLPSNSPWMYAAIQWGLSYDIPTPGDYDGDGSGDIAVWRHTNGTWYVKPSGSPGTYTATPWGMEGDIPLSADYDGDGKADIAVWRPSSGTWYILPSRNPGTYMGIQWGIQSDIPTPGDYDADGKTDIAVWRPNTGVWYILPSASPGNYTTVNWGLNTDTPVSGDYDGDGKADVAVWRSSNGIWYIMPSSAPGTYTSTQWGMAGDEAVSGLSGIMRLVR